MGGVLNVYLSDSLEVNFDGPQATVAGPAGAAVFFGEGGPAGADSAIDFMVEFSGFNAGQRVDMGGALARAFPATAAASVAYTDTPPATTPVTIGLTDKGVQFGTATWAVGQNFGVLSWVGEAPFVRQSVPGGILPSPLDAAFTQFAITFAA